MTPLSCSAVHRRLQAYHDDELPVQEQIAVSAHVEWCPACAAALSDLDVVRAALLDFTPGRSVLSNEEAAAFTGSAVARMKAEQQASLFARVRDMFDDIRLVYAGVGAAIATVVCVAITLGMMRFATSERPDSLAAIVNLVSTPAQCEVANELPDASACHARWEARVQAANEWAEQDSVFALNAVVTHQSGHLANLEVLRAGRRETARQAKTIEGLLDALTRSRLETDIGPRLPVSVSMVFLVEHATVRANIIKPIPLVEPMRKKRIAVGPQSNVAGALS